MRTPLYRWAFLCLALLICLYSVRAANDEDAKHGDEKDHVMLTPDKIKWGPAPPSLPSGAQLAVLAGNPTEKGPFTIRVKLPDGFRVPPHWHPSDENVTVIQGTFNMGRGEKFNASDTQALPAGSYVRMPRTMRHFAWAKGETIVQVHGMGPFEINYVNPDDDPRKKNEK
jgi:quercetin dioxygenase-like cupin family protein